MPIHEHASTFPTQDEDDSGILTDENWVATDTSYTPAPNVPATVAPFRAWRDLQLVVAGEPIPVTIMRLSFRVGQKSKRMRILLVVRTK